MKFRHLQPSDHPDLKRFFETQRYRLCVYSLPSLLAWSNEIFQPYGAVEDGALIVYAECPDRPADRHMILPLSPEKEHTPEQLHALARRAGHSAYWFVPEDYLERYGQERVGSFFTVQEQKAFHDYIYLARDLAGLRGNRYSKKRNLIRQFQKEYLRPARVKIERLASSVVDECLDFLEQWCEERGCGAEQDENLFCEKRAIINTFENLEIMQVNGILLRIDGKVSALGVGSHLTGDTGVLHYEKAFSAVKGLYQFFDKACARILFRGYTYINKESDMDVPGMAKAKRSYYPVMQVRSFRLDVRR